MLLVRLPPLRSPLSQLNSVFLAVKRQVEGQPPELADTDVTRDFRLHLGRPQLADKHQSQPNELPSITTTPAAASSSRSASEAAQSLAARASLRRIRVASMSSSVIDRKSVALGQHVSVSV